MEGGVLSGVGPLVDPVAVLLVQVANLSSKYSSFFNISFVNCYILAHNYSGCKSGCWLYWSFSQSTTGGLRGCCRHNSRSICFNEG